MIEWAKNNPVVLIIVGFSLLSMMFAGKRHKELVGALRRRK